MQEKILPKQKTRISNIHSSEFGAILYDIFGSPYQKSGSFLAHDSLDFGYLGNPYNSDTELYDYGFRDYSTEIARFTTVDPIRDGRNWFAMAPQRIVANAGKQEQTVNKDKNK